MVDDLLNVTRIQSGKVVMKLEKVNLSDIFEERLAIAQESAGKHQFMIDIEQGLPPVLVDRDKFGEVIGNLLSNAVKYSPKWRAYHTFSPSRTTESSCSGKHY